MTRRQFVAAAGTAGAVAGAGCLEASALTGPTSLDWLGTETEFGGREHHLFFGTDEPAVTVTIRQEAVAPADPATAMPIPYFLLVHHPEGWRMDALRVKFRAPPADGSPFDAAVSVSSPPTDLYPPLSVRRDADGWTAVDWPDLGEPHRRTGTVPGAGNVGLDFALVPSPSHPVAALVVDVDAAFSEPATAGRRRYRARRTARFPLVVETRRRDPAH